MFFSQAPEKWHYLKERYNHVNLLNCQKICCCSAYVLLKIFCIVNVNAAVLGQSFHFYAGNGLGFYGRGLRNIQLRIHKMILVRLLSAPR
jgi:hypothetical protein